METCATEPEPTDGPTEEVNEYYGCLENGNDSCDCGIGEGECCETEGYYWTTECGECNGPNVWMVILSFVHRPRRFRPKSHPSIPFQFQPQQSVKFSLRPPYFCLFYPTIKKKNSSHVNLTFIYIIITHTYLFYSRSIIPSFVFRILVLLETPSKGKNSIKPWVDFFCLLCIYIGWWLNEK